MKMKDRKKYRILHLDVIISVGYRVKFKRGVQFGIWITNLIKKYMKKGLFLMMIA